MGMYTQLSVAFNLQQDVPADVPRLLQWMAGEETEQPPLPDHPLFQYPRKVSGLLTRGSYYFDGPTTSIVGWDTINEFWAVLAHCNMKNYGSEIEHFLDWVAPYIDIDYPWQYIGTKRYEEDELPTLVIVRDRPRSVEYVDLKRPLDLEQRIVTLLNEQLGG